MQRVLDSIPRKSSWLVHTRHAKPYTDSGFESIFQRIKARAKLEDVHFHDIRAKAATDLDKSKTSIRDVQTLLGHSSVTTTERYLKKLEQTESDDISVDVDIDVDTP
ncbi:tyrosine-type recombinase/integrase [Acidithiobacillus ferrooxidans]|nr:tyrosine-type recombinase/integrase [Acidithiobacillus ferridurans]MBU2825807.1 tyrosine-type recombinase/integrase [Acidithiobacillus ferrooxidans]